MSDPTHADAPAEGDAESQLRAALMECRSVLVGISETGMSFQSDTTAAIEAANAALSATGEGRRGAVSELNNVAEAPGEDLRDALRECRQALNKARVAIGMHNGMAHPYDRDWPEQSIIAAAIARANEVLGEAT